MVPTVGPKQRLFKSKTKEYLKLFHPCSTAVCKSGPVKGKLHLCFHLPLVSSYYRVVYHKNKYNTSFIEPSIFTCIYDRRIHESDEIRCFNLHHG